MFDYKFYIREEKFPHIWCPGCGHGIILKAILRSIDKMGWDKNKIVFVSGIGCSGRSPGYVDFNTLHTTHGRAIAFATGIKLANPELHVIVASGDGDAVAIGGNHFIHAARRNIDITVVVFNNYIYGMTGGQNSPTTPENARSTTMPFGNLDPPFDIVQLSLGSGATFVARATVAQPNLLDLYIKKALAHKGFSVVDAISTCPVAFGRRNKMKSPVKMIRWLEEKSVRVKKGEDEYHGIDDTIPVGVFRDVKKPEYIEKYYEFMKSLKEEKQK